VVPTTGAGLRPLNAARQVDRPAGERQHRPGDEVAGARQRPAEGGLAAYEQGGAVAMDGRTAQLDVAIHSSATTLAEFPAAEPTGSGGLVDLLR
jgi:hypothetical protein